MEKQRVLITEDGTWVRIYPVPFRRLNEEQQYKKFEDTAGKKSELQVLDWEAGVLYWNYFDELTKKDLHFFLGTTQQFHFVAPRRRSSGYSEPRHQC
jgi:hypothetical protein